MKVLITMSATRIMDIPDGIIQLSRAEKVLQVEESVYADPLLFLDHEDAQITVLVEEIP